MAISTWQEIKDNRYWALFDFFILLAILAVLGSAFAVSIALIPIINSALALSLLPQFMVGFSVLLAFIACLALLVNFLLIQGGIIMMFYHKPLLVFKQYFLMVLLAKPFALWVSSSMQVQSYFQWHHQKEKKKNCSVLFHLYLFSSVLTALGLGAYLSVAILPTLLSGLAVATGLPYAVVFLFGMLAAALLLMLTYDLLVLPIRIFNLALRFKFWKDADQYKDLFFHLAHGLILLTGVGLTAYASYLLFPMILQSLLPLLPAAMAVFTAVLIGVGLVTLAMETLPIMVGFLGEVIRRLADRGHDNKPSQFTSAFKAFERDCRLSLLGAGSQLIDLQTELKADYEPIVSFINVSRGSQKISSQQWRQVIGWVGVVYMTVPKSEESDEGVVEERFRSPPPGWCP